MTINLKNNREVCWDDYLIEKADGIKIQMHQPIKRNAALTLDAKWEGTGCGYFNASNNVGGKIRLYYRSGGVKDVKGEFFCFAESDDGIEYKRPNLGLKDFCGDKNNNIHFTEDRFIDNFSVYEDKNPDCPPEGRFKAVSLIFKFNETEPIDGIGLFEFDGKEHSEELGLYQSADGINFEFVRVLDVKGVFDSNNILMWDEKEEVYRLYLRDFHDKDGNDVEYVPDDKVVEPWIRDVRLSKSKDLITWTKPEKLIYHGSAEDYQLYTSQIVKYHRADIFIGIPTRYINRIHDAAPANFKHLPSWEGGRQIELEAGRRLGSATTDAILMTSRDGLNFLRCDEQFLGSGLEKEHNWIYGDGYVAYGITETPIEGNEGKTELSIYSTDDYRNPYTPNCLYRYTIRLDGFFSWRGDFKGGYVLTKPITFEGDSMEINFATSALGSVRVELCDLNGDVIEGYDSGNLFGDSLDRPVEFEKSLKELNGQEIKIKFTLKDADLYSFKFN